MSYRYERTLAPSEEVTDYASKALGVDVEYPIWAHYLHVTQADLKPGGSGIPADFRDTGVPSDYIKLLVQRHQQHVPTLKESDLHADQRITGKFAIPDISTYRGRFVPPRVVRDSTGRVLEDRGRCEYYEIKPNSDQGQEDGVKKLAVIAKSLKAHKLDLFYAPGAVYPVKNPDYIPLVWSEVFEYLRLVFMWENNLKECKVDLQVVKHEHPLPNKSRGLILYAFRITLELDVQLAMTKLRVLAGAVAFALALCAVAGVLELGLDFVAVAAAAELLEFLKSLPAPDVPEAPTLPPPKFRVPPVDPAEPRIRVEPEPVPNELPEIKMEPDDASAPGDNVELPRRKRAIVEGIIGRGYGIPGKRYDIYCDEDYYQNIIVDPTTAQRFIDAVRVRLPKSPALVAPNAALSTYGQLIAPGWTLATRLVEDVQARFPNQVGAKILETIPAALRRLIGMAELSEATIVSQVLPGTALIAAFLDPSLKANARKRVAAPNRGLGRGKIVLPQAILSRWAGRDANMGARAKAETPEDVKKMLLGAASDEGYRKFLTDALSNLAPLKFALNAAPGFTLAIGIHGLYRRPAHAQVTAETRYGTLEGSLHVSRLFAIATRAGSRIPGPYTRAELKQTADDPSETTAGIFRFLGRIRLQR